MASNIPVIVQGNSFSLAIPLQIYYINGDQMDLQDYTPDPTDEVSVQLKGSRRNYTYTPTIDSNIANIDLTGNELADNYSVVVSVVKADGQRLRSFRTDQFFIVESSDDLTQADIIAGLEENVIYLNSSIFVAGADGRGIVSIVKTSTSGLVDTYTITYTDNTTSTFNVTNGAQGEAGSSIASIAKTGTSGLVDTYTITLTDGSTTTFEVTNGMNGVDLGLANIVNDLTTGGATNVLSAEMGKVLGDMGDAVLRHTDTPTVNLFDKDAVETNKSINYTNGNLVGLSGYDATDFIPIDSRGLYFDKAFGGGANAGSAVYNSQKEFIRGQQVAKQITYQEGDAYVRFSVKHENIDVAMCVAGTSADIPSEYVPYGNIRTYELKGDIVGTDAIKDKAVTAEKIADEVIIGNKTFTDESYQSPNLFDKSTASLDIAIAGTSGIVFIKEGYCCSAYIAIPAGVDKMYQAVGYTPYGNIGWACYNASKAFTHGGSSKLITFQENDAFVRIVTDMDNIEQEMLVAGDESSVPAHYLPYGIIEKYLLKDDTVPFYALDFRVIEIGKNKLNPDEIEDGKAINERTGVVVAASGLGLSATGYIPVSKKGLFFNALYRGGNNWGAAVYDNSKTYIRGTTQVYTYQDGDAFVRYTLKTSDKATAQVEEGSKATDYEAYTTKEVINPSYLPSSSVKDEEDGEVPVILPEKLFAVVGDTLQVFFKQCVQSIDPLKYNILVACSKGRQYHRYFEYTPAAGDVGETTFSLYVKDDFGNVIGHGSCTLVTVAVPSSPATTTKILCIGDSLTANGIWPSEAYRRLTGNGGTPAGNGLTNIEFVGSMEASGAGYLGYSGWGWSNYCTGNTVAFRFTVGTNVNVNIGAIYRNNSFDYTVVEVSDNGTILCTTPRSTNVPLSSGVLTKVSGGGDASISYTAYTTDAANPFWDGTKLTFIPYVNQYCGGSIDEVFILLGANGLINWKNDFSNYIGYIEVFLNTLHAEYPSAKVVLMGMQFPSMELMMPNYGASGTSFSDTYGILVSIARLRNLYKAIASRDEYSSFVSAIDIGCQFDGDYNYWTEQKPVNTRQPDVVEPYDYNAVHPSANGYRQFADAVYRKLIYDLSLL